MVEKAFFQKIRTDYSRYEDARRALIKEAGDGLSHAKQAIFSFHRDDQKTGEEHLLKSREIQKTIAKQFRKIPGLIWEGSYHAMLEEYVEASLFCDFLLKKNVGPIAGEGIDTDTYLGGLMDFTGELVRRAVTQATLHKNDEVHRCHKAVQAVLGELVKMNIVGSLRPKYDQTKTNFRKLEDIVYDLSRGTRHE